MQTPVIGQQLYGGFPYGGADQMGSIGHYDLATGSLQDDHFFETQFPGATPYGGVIEVNSKLYGTTVSGGRNSQGLLYEWDLQTGTYSRKVDLADVNLFHPYSTLTYLNGKIFGTTSNGIFEWDITTNVVTVKVNLDTNKGYSPFGAMVYVNGKFYGTANYGGLYNNVYGYGGVIFEWDPVSNVYSKKHQFDFVNGSRPEATLCYHAGKFYGVTYSGGAANSGVLFEWDPLTNTYLKKMDFTGLNGRYPIGGVVELNGKIYGTTNQGGSNFSETNGGTGVLYEWDPATGDFATKFDLATKGIYYPSASMTKLGGKLYGTGNSSLFEYDPGANNLVRKVSMDGHYSRGQLTLVGSDFFGTTSSGGASGRGILFKWTPATNAYTKLMDFSFAPRGFQPNPRLSEIGNGKIYGVTLQGGPTNSAAIFEYDIASKQLVRKVQAPHSAPGTSLVHHAGKFYLTTYSNIYEWDPVTNLLRHRVSFFGINGNSAYGDVVYHDGKFYGTTAYGGGVTGAETNFGVIFSWDPETNVFTKKYDFDGTNGAHPYGSLTLFNGRFYGTTVQGGANEVGVLFEWDPATNGYQKLLDFTQSARHPYAGLTLFNEKLYGSTNSGTNSLGSLFEFDPVSKTMSKSLILTNYLNGAHPQGTAFTEINGKLYGTMPGGLHGYGVVFEWDPAANVYHKKIDLTSSQNGGTYFSSLLPIGTKRSQEISFAGPLTATYGTQPFQLVATSTSGLPVNFTSSNRNVATINGNEITILAAGTTVIRAYQNGDNATYPAKTVDVTLTVAKAKLQVTAEDKERQYGINNPALTVSYSGFVNGDNVTRISQPQARTTANQATPVGVHPITVSGGSAANYFFEYIAGKLTITKATLTAAAVSNTRVYGVNTTLQISYSGFRNGDDANDITPPAITTTATQFSSPGEYPITLTGGSAVNYQFKFVDGILRIERAPLEAIADNKSKVYLADNPELTISYKGFMGTDNAGHLDELPLAATIAKKDSDAGDYAITLSGGMDNNYKIALTNGNLKIEKAPQTITFEELPEKTTFDPPFELTATSSSGLTVAFASTDESLATIAGNILTIVGEGSVDIVAYQDGNHNYHPAVQVTRSLIITGKQEQQITFPALRNDLFAGQTLQLGAVASSGLDVTYAIDDPSIAVIQGGNVSLLKGGITLITASQDGNDEFYPAEEVQQTLDVHSIELTDLQEVYCSGNPFTISFDIAGTFAASNVFTLELSSASGSFDNPYVIGTSYGNSSGFFSGDMPGDVPQGDGYRIRVKSSEPEGVVLSAKSLTIDTHPVIVSLTAPINPMPVNTSISVSLKFSDRELSGNLIEWGDGFASSGTENGDMINASHVYTTPGVYTVTATVRDACGREAQQSHQYVVIYDPYGGFVTGGGWFESPAGAYVTEPLAIGKATFGFVSKYQKGSTAPTGNTDFQFQTVNLRFKSTSYEWLVIAGHKAMYKGVGNLNGAAGYGFLISAVDGDKSSSNVPDKLRMKIWDAYGAVVYDNQLGASEESEATTAIGAGSIVIHEAQKSNSSSARTTESPGEETILAHETSLRVYPNPFINKVTVVYQSDSKEDLNFHLLDVTGRTIYNNTHSYRDSGLYEVDLSAQPLSPQIYLLRVNQGQRLALLKLVAK